MIHDPVPLAALAVPAIAIPLLLRRTVRDAPGGPVVTLAYGAGIRRVVAALWLFPAALLVAAALSRHPDDARWALGAAGVASALLLLLTVECLGRRVFADERGLRAVSAWSRPRAVAWSEVGAFLWTAEAVLVVRGPRTRIEVPPMLSGRPALAERLAEWAPAVPGLEAVRPRLAGGAGAPVLEPVGPPTGGRLTPDEARRLRLVRTVLKAGLFASSLAVGALLLADDGVLRGVPLPLLQAGAVAATVATLSGFAFWRCPRCAARLKGSLDPAACGGCGVELKPTLDASRDGA